MTNLYMVENHVKYTMDAECKALTETKQTKGKAALNANRYIKRTRKFFTNEYRGTNGFRNICTLVPKKGLWQYPLNKNNNNKAFQSKTNHPIASRSGAGLRVSLCGEGRGFGWALS